MLSLAQNSLMLERQWKDMSLYLKGVKLLWTRRKQAIFPIVRKALNGLFGTVPEDDMRTIRRKLGNVERDQQVLTQVTKESLSIFNITRLELVENRGSINCKPLRKKYLM